MLKEACAVTLHANCLLWAKLLVRQNTKEVGLPWICHVLELHVASDEGNPQCNYNKLTSCIIFQFTVCSVFQAVPVLFSPRVLPN